MDEEKTTKIVDTMPVKSIKKINDDMNQEYLKNNVGKEVSFILLIKMAIKCWNCDSTLLIFPDWRIVQCTQCMKLNRIPGTGSFDDPNDKLVGKLTYRDKPKEVEFDIMFPVTVSDIKLKSIQL